MMTQATVLDVCAMLLQMQHEEQKLLARLGNLLRSVRAGDLPREIALAALATDEPHVKSLYLQEGWLRLSLLRFQAANDLDGGGDEPRAA